MMSAARTLRSEDQRRVMPLWLIPPFLVPLTLLLLIGAYAALRAL